MKYYFTTAEVAKFCHVTRLSVINWVDKGLIPAVRTPGRHRKIFRNDLVKFMQDHEINLKDIDLSLPDIEFRWCWEYHKKDNYENHKCRGCLVYLTNAKKCFSLREKIGHKRVYCKFNCKKCDYFKDYHDYFQWCWEFHQETGRADHKCQECIVYLSGIKKCFVLREETEHKKIFCKSDCAECNYYQKFVRQDRTGGKTSGAPLVRTVDNSDGKE